MPCAKSRSGVVISKTNKIYFLCKMSYTNIIAIFTLFCALVDIGSTKRLNEFVRHYEPLDYDSRLVHQKHSHLKNWLERYEEKYKPEPIVNLEFNAHKRQFNLELMRDTETFSPSLKLDGDENFFIHDLAHLFTGRLTDVPGSYVHGSVVNGVFSGKIAFPEETFYVERSPKYSQHLQNSSIHSVIYSENDLQNPSTQHSKNDTGCGVQHGIHEWMKNIANSEIKPQSIFEDYLTPEQTYTSILTLEKGAGYSNDSKNFYDSPSVTISRRRKRETTPGPTVSGSPTTCTLYIRTDPMFWKEISKQQGTKDKTPIKEEILSIIGQHVKAANDIFSSTLFKWNDEMFKNIRFVVQTVKIDTDEDCEPPNNGTGNPFCAENIDVSNFLEIHSRDNHEAFCLSYAFTYRDFTGGVIGLAWVASLNAAGGICQKQARYYDDVGSDKRRCLNTGIVTFLNYGRHLPSRLSELTFTHELGHNFGAPHDSKDCSPGGSEGNYVMYSSSTNGYLPNNILFSECSIQSISEILDQTYNSQTRRNCFVATDGAFCGNQIVEDGEECDCGYISEECKENCCYPRRTTDLTGGGPGPGNSLSCKRKPQALCSPSEGPCCQAETCQFSTRRDHGNVPCKRDTECSEPSFCSGLSPLCPVPKFKPDNTECNKGSEVCIDGECRGSICLKFGLEQCFLSSSEYSDKRELCKIACKDRNGFCKPTSELGVPDFTPNLSLRPGSPCDNFKGYCDVFQKCRQVDEKGPLLRLKRLFFNRRSYRGLADWCLKNWWGVALMAIGFVILMALFIRCCAVHTPSSNPYLPKNVKFSQTMRKPMSSLRKQPKPNRAGGVDYGTATARTGEEHIPMEEPRYP